MNAVWQPVRSFTRAARGVGDILGIVLHDSECPEAAMVAALNSNGVSAHYSVGEDGQLYQHVQDADIAYHAAAFGSTPTLNRTKPHWLPAWQGEPYSAVNKWTIGIELAGYAARGFTPAQYVSLGALVRSLCERYGLPMTCLDTDGQAARIVTHGSLQTDRSDPGPLFDWDQFRAAMAPPVGQEDTVDDTERAAMQARIDELVSTNSALADQVGALRDEIRGLREETIPTLEAGTADQATLDDLRDRLARITALAAA